MNMSSFLIAAMVLVYSGAAIAQLGSSNDAPHASSSAEPLLQPTSSVEQIQLEVRGKSVQIRVSAPPLRVNKDAVRRKDNSQLQRLIKDIEEIVGSLPDVDLRITHVNALGDHREGIESVHLTQFINGLEATRSTFLVDQEGFVSNLLLTIVDPTQPNTDQRHWISLDEGRLAAKAALENNAELMFLEQDVELVYDRTLLRLEEDEQTVTPLYIFNCHSYAIAVNALSGEANVTLLASIEPSR